MSMCRCSTVKDCIQGCVKTILLLINIIVIVAALLFIGVGGYVQAELHNGSALDNIDCNIGPLAIAMLVIGSVLFMIAILGCIGTCTGRTHLLNGYIGLLLLVIVLQAGLVIYGYIFKTRTKKLIEEAMIDSFEAVNNETVNATSLQISYVDSIQSIVMCCGETGPDFWTRPDFHGMVPSSCCIYYMEETLLCQKENAYSVGCLQSSEELIDSLLMKVLVVKMGIIAFLALCIIMAHYSKSGKPTKGYDKLSEHSLLQDA